MIFNGTGKAHCPPIVVAWNKLSGEMAAFYSGGSPCSSEFRDGFHPHPYRTRPRRRFSPESAQENEFHREKIEI
jgi:hypothetical protein